MGALVAQVCVGELIAFNRRSFACASVARSVFSVAIWVFDRPAGLQIAIAFALMRTADCSGRVRGVRGADETYCLCSRLGAILRRHEVSTSTFLPGMIPVTMHDA